MSKNVKYSIAKLMYTFSHLTCVLICWIDYYPWGLFHFYMLPTHGPPLKIVEGVSPPHQSAKKSLRGYGVGHNGWKKWFRGVIFTWKSMRGYPPQWFFKIVEGGYFGWKFTTLKHLKRRERWKISLFLFQLRVFPPPPKLASFSRASSSCVSGKY